MADFHVVALLYRLESSDHVSYTEPPSLVFENEVARFHLEKDQLRSELKLHVGTLEEARALVDPILRGWELEVELARGPGQMRFTYENAEIIDRTPPTPGVISGHVMVTLQDAFLVSTGNLSSHIMRKNYGEPPVGFRLTPDAESILLRFRAYQNGREPILSMAYFCLTVVESAAGGRRNAAKTLRINEDILHKVGDFTSNRGDRAIARKAHSSVQLLTGAERAWIEATMKQLVLRLCAPPPQYERKQLTMADLPAL